ncbi:MAG: hypothetical protein V4501_08295 [Pseudomonadota bacterium]
MSEKSTNENQLKSDAIMGFVDLMIQALDSGFVEINNPTLAEIHRVAESHIKDNYNIQVGSIIDRHGNDLAMECGSLDLRSIDDDGLLMSDKELDDLLVDANYELTNASNFLRGASLDPQIPKGVKEAFASKINDLEEINNKIIGVLYKKGLV